MDNETITIPVLDLEEVKITLKDTEIASETFTRIGDQLKEALVDVGFLYIKNHGIPAELIKECCAAGRQFFDLPDEVKLARLRDWKEGFCGYMPFPKKDTEDFVEKFDLTKPADCKETLNVCHICEPKVWPDKELPQLRTSTMSLISSGQELTRRLLLLIGHALVPSNPTGFLEGFKEAGTKGNMSQVRHVLYPAVSAEEVTKGGLRCGEHTDFGLITLLFLDSTPGLQVYSRQKTYLDIEGLEDTILVNIGDLFQRWTCDVLHSAKHRVVYRPDTFDKERYSLIYFSVSDDNAVIKPLIEPFDKYPPVTTIEHIKKRAADIFVEGRGVDENISS